MSKRVDQFAIDIDDFTEEIFHMMEHIADRSCNHKAIFKGSYVDEVSADISDRLRVFLEEQLYVSDDNGYPVEED